ncbi:MAG: PAS domain S-box protein [Bacteroidales bacterium]|nr:PAS domain S-box protein [Bacteroidales bacterium]
MDRIFAPDIRTIVFNYLIISLVSVLVLAILWQQNRKRYAGIGFWIACFLLQFGAIILILFRMNIPDWLSLILSSIMIFAGMLFNQMGLERFIGKARNHIFSLVMMVFYILAQIWFTCFHDSLSDRKLIFSLMFMAFSFQSLWLILYGTRGVMRKLVTPLAWIFGAFFFVSFLRVIKFFLDDNPATDFFQTDISEAFIFFLYQLFFFLFLFVLVLIYNKRVLTDISLQEEKYLKAFESSPYGILFTRLSDGMIIEANVGFMTCFGYSDSDLFEKTTLDIMLWENYDARSHFVRELIEKNVIKERELKFRAKSGDIKTALVSSELVLLNNEKYILLSINDISLRKEAENQLTEKMDELQRLNRIMAGRENRMIEMKKEINDICLKSDLPARYSAPENAIFKDVQIRDTAAGGDKKIIEDLYEMRSAAVNLIEDLSTEIERRKQAELSIAQTERYFRSLIEKSSEGVVLVDKNGQMTYASPSAKMLFGYPQDEKNLPDPNIGTHPEDLPRVLETIGKIMHDPQLILTIEYRFMNNDKTFKWIESTFTNLLTEEGIESLVINFRDITERKKAELALFQRFELQDQLSKIALTVPGMIFSFKMRPDGSFYMPYCTPLLEDLWGLRPEELKDDFSPAIEMIKLEDMAHTVESIIESARTMSPWRDTFRVNHPEKGELWIEGSSLPRLEPDGSILWHGFIQDVTSRKQTELILKDSERRYRELVENSNSAIIRWNSDGKIMFFNEYAQKFFGYTNEEILGQSVGMLIPETESTGRDLTSMLHDILYNPENYINQVNENICRDGRRVWIAWTNKPILDESGRVCEILAVGVDITALKMAEEAYRTLLEVSLDAIFIDQSGVVIYINKSGLKLFGTDNIDSIVGKSPYEFFHPDHHDVIRRRIDHMLKNKVPAGLIEERIVKMDGTLVDVEVTATPFVFRGATIDSGNPARYL